MPTTLHLTICSCSCAFYLNTTTLSFEFGRFTGIGGNITPLVVAPPISGVYDGIAAGAENGEFVSGVGSTAIVVINWVLNSSTMYSVAPPAGYTQPAFVRDLGTDWSGSRPSLVALLTDDDIAARQQRQRSSFATAPRDRGPTANHWWLLASIDTTSGVATALRNVSGEMNLEQIKYGSFAFDSSRRVAWMVGWTTSANLTLTLLGLPASASATPPEAIAFVGEWYDCVALLYSEHFDALIALATYHNTTKQPMVWVVRDASTPSGWRPLFAYPVGTVAHPAMGNAATERSGTIVATLLLDLDTDSQVVSYVDLVSGVELSRSAIADHVTIADFAFC